MHKPIQAGNDAASGGGGVLQQQRIGGVIGVKNSQPLMQPFRFDNALIRRNAGNQNVRVAQFGVAAAGIGSAAAQLFGGFHRVFIRAVQNHDVPRSGVHHAVNGGASGAACAQHHNFFPAQVNAAFLQRRDRAEVIRIPANQPAAVIFDGVDRLKARDALVGLVKSGKQVMLERRRDVASGERQGAENFRGLLRLKRIDAEIMRVKAECLKRGIPQLRAAAVQHGISEHGKQFHGTGGGPSDGRRDMAAPPCGAADYLQLLV